MGLRDAATVILVRPGVDAVEVFLLRRRKGASFMSGSFVFPGGIAEPGEDDPRITAARELFEEAGVLLATRAIADEERRLLRARVLAGEPAAAVLAEAGLALDPTGLHYFAHWITPSAEPRRYDTRFFVAVLPAGQEPSFDAHETVDQVWTTPADALARARDLALPPPQVRTLGELSGSRTVADVLALAGERARAPHPIMPRLAPLGGEGGGFALLLPWDPEYLTAGTGDAAPMAADHPLAIGPSRFVLEDRTWKNVGAPGSTRAG
ncbi:MAG TPA: NUDIX domain-containing protein [Kofleriaceae bacterium]|nr:NUDIX domain-containing protein [Kofleriaceae bacterium]